MAAVKARALAGGSVEADRLTCAPCGNGGGVSRIGLG
jgi:hypothetical protein